MKRALLVVLVLVLAACKRDDTTAKPRADAGGATHLVRIAPALLANGRVATGRVARRAPTGTIRLAADVVSSPEGLAEAGTLLPGRLARFEAREGDHVTQNQVLAWLDSPEAAHAVADVLHARARAETQARKVTRLEGLVAQEAATQLALEDARLELGGSRADLAAARTLLASVGISEPPAGNDAPVVSARLPIRSPVDGTIVERGASLGAHITPETRLFRIVREGGVLVEARLPDGASVVLAPGSTTAIEQRGVATCKGRVLGTLPEVAVATRTRRVRISADPGCVGLVIGAQAEVAIDVPAAPVDGGAADVLAIRASAIVEVKSTPMVFARVGDAFEVRPVEPGLRFGDDRVLLSGASEGDELVIEGAVLLKGELLRAELTTE